LVAPGEAETGGERCHQVKWRTLEHKVVSHMSYQHGVGAYDGQKAVKKNDWYEKYLTIGIRQK